MKRLWIMIALLLCFVLPGVAEEYTYGDYKYTVLKNGTAEITKYLGSQSNVTVPSKINGYKVTSIGELAFYKSFNLSDSTWQKGKASITLPNTLTNIGERAFAKCDRLTSITLPEGLISIENGAFSECIGLTSVTLPDSLVNINGNPFYECCFLEEIRVSPDHPVFATIDGVLFHKADKRLVCYPEALPATEYDVPNGILSIGDYAFAYNQILKNISLPESLKNIGENSFYSCKKLESIKMPDNLSSIGYGAFQVCSNLQDIILPEGITNIEDDTFNTCSSLKNITLPSSLTSIGERAFIRCYKLTDIKLPEGLTHIDDNAFYDCDSLTSINIPDSVNSMGDNPFVRCENLRDILISPDHPVFEIIDGVLFDKNNKSLICYPCGFTASEYTVPQGTLIIAKEAFQDCITLKSITLPKSVTRIESRVFDGCTKLTKFIVPRDSYAATYCQKNKLPYTYPNANDWLNN